MELLLIEIWSKSTVRNHPAEPISIDRFRRATMLVCFAFDSLGPDIRTSARRTLHPSRASDRVHPASQIAFADCRRYPCSLSPDPRFSFQPSAPSFVFLSPALAARPTNLRKRPTRLLN